MASEFSVENVLELTNEGKYATVVSGFEFIDFSRSIELPKRMRKRKEAVKAMYALNNGIVKWDYASEEMREALREELGLQSQKQVEPMEVVASKETTKATAEQKSKAENDSTLKVSAASETKKAVSANKAKDSSGGLRSKKAKASSGKG